MHQIFIFFVFYYQYTFNYCAALLNLQRNSIAKKRGKDSGNIYLNSKMRSLVKKYDILAFLQVYLPCPNQLRGYKDFRRQLLVPLKPVLLLRGAGDQGQKLQPKLFRYSLSLGE
jgi:hypothetical protein